MTHRLFAVLTAVAALCGACSPTVHVKLDPIIIRAELDADVRLHLDEDIKRLIEENPELF